MSCFLRLLQSCCFDGGGEVPPPTQRPIQHNVPPVRTAPYPPQQSDHRKLQARDDTHYHRQKYQESHHSKPQSRSEYPTDYQRRVHVGSDGIIRTAPLHPPKPPTYHPDQERNGRPPKVRPETTWGNFVQNLADDAESVPSPSDRVVPQDSYPDEKRDNIQQSSSPWEDGIPRGSYPDEKRGNFQQPYSPYGDAIPQDSYPDEKAHNRHRLSSPWDGHIPQEIYDELSKTDYNHSSTPPPQYHPPPPKQEQHRLVPPPLTISTPVKGPGRSNVQSGYYIPSYYAPKSPDVMTPSTLPEPPIPPVPTAKVAHRYEFQGDEDSSDEETNYHYQAYQGGTYQDPTYQHPDYQDPKDSNQGYHGPSSYDNQSYKNLNYNQSSGGSEWTRGQEEEGEYGRRLQQEEDMWEEEYAVDEEEEEEEEEETRREEQKPKPKPWHHSRSEQQRERETRYEDTRIVSGVSSLGYYSEAAHAPPRPVSDVSAVSDRSSHYSEGYVDSEDSDKEVNKRWTPIAQVKPPPKWGNEKYKQAENTLVEGERKDYGWL